MARILVTTMPFHSHINTSAAVVVKLVERGHQVWWYTGKKYQAKVEATGAHFVPFHAAPDFDDADIAKTFPQMGKLRGLANMKYMIKHVVMDSVPGQLQDLQEIIARFPAEVLLADMSLYGAGWLHELGGPIWASHGPFPLSITSQDTAPFGLALPPDASRLGRWRNRSLNWLIKNVLLADCMSYTNQIRAKVGLPPEKRIMLDSCISPYLFMQGTVPSFEYPRHDLPSQVHFVGPWLSPTSLAEFTPPVWWSELKAGRPVVHVTQGTLATDPLGLIIPTIKALADLDVLVVATTGGQPLETVQLSERPANLRLEKFIPHAQLLPYVDVMVTNAGYGGVQMALSQGVPLVAAGDTEDKPEVAARVAWAGVGLNLKTGRPTPPKIRAAVEQVLSNPSYRQQARHFQALFSQYDGPTRAAELLEELIATRQPVTRFHSRSVLEAEAVVS